MKIRTKKIRAGEEIVEDVPCCEDVLFEAADVGQLLEEVTGEDVEVSMDDESGDVIIQVGEDEYTITPDEDTEVVTTVAESSRRPLRGKQNVKANSRLNKTRNTVSAGARVRSGRTIRRISTNK